MSKRLYVGGLSYQTTEQDLGELFSEVGGVASIRIIMDRETGRSKGFGFVETISDDFAATMIQRFDGIQYQGRRLTVNEAKPQEPRQSGGFGGPRREGYGGNYGGRDSYGGARR